MNVYGCGPFIYYDSETETKKESTIYRCININCIELEERGEKGSCIFTVANVFTDVQCDVMVDYILKHSALWEEKDVGSKTYNNVKCKYLTLKDMVSSNIPYSKELDDLIFKSVGKVLIKLRESNPAFDGTQDTGYTLRKIYGGTKHHIDGVHSKTGWFKNFVRCLSIIVVLNDDYDGGIFNFPKQNLKLKVKKGEAIMFPPYWTHPHSVTSVGEGQARYTINTWILEKFID